MKKTKISKAITTQPLIRALFSSALLPSALLIGTLLIFLVAYGEGTGVISNTRIGQLIGNGSVKNLYYVTESHSGYTGSEGEFVYEPGENIQFYDGNILIAKTTATDVIASFSPSGITLSAE